MNFSRLNTIYWSKTIYNDDASNNINADINDTFTSNLLESMNDWVCCVERMEVSTNAIPYYDGSYEQESFSWDGGTASTSTIVSYSLEDTIDKLEKLMSDNKLGKLTIKAPWYIVWAVSTSVDAITTKITLPPKLNEILGFKDGTLSDNEKTSVVPRLGLGDQLQHVQIRSNMNLVSDTVGQTKTNIVTDLSTGISYNVSSTIANQVSSTLSGTARDKLIYVPTQRRWLNFNASSPLQVIRIFCEYVRPDGVSRMVTLPLGGVFTVKLGFYQRT
jgi:hypothetical protein